MALYSLYMHFMYASSTETKITFLLTILGTFLLGGLVLFALFRIVLGAGDENRAKAAEPHAGTKMLAAAAKRAREENRRPLSQMKRSEDGQVQLSAGAQSVLDGTDAPPPAGDDDEGDEQVPTQRRGRTASDAHTEQQLLELAAADPQSEVGVRRLVDRAMKMEEIHAKPVTESETIIATSEMEAKVKSERLNIPLGAAEQVVQRGKRLVEDGDAKQGLACFLALLYTAVDDRTGDLPVHLTDCLRGAALCLRSLGEAETALRFLQVERLVFEEMVAGMTGIPREEGVREALVSKLFKAQPTEDEAEIPRRVKVLTDVADKCMRLGYPKVALSYRVKAAALKQKQTGKALDPEGPDFTAIAETLRACAPENAAQAAQSQKEKESSLQQGITAASQMTMARGGVSPPPVATPGQMLGMGSRKPRKVESEDDGGMSEGEKRQPKKASDEQGSKKQHTKRPKRKGHQLSKSELYDIDDDDDE